VQAVTAELNIATAVTGAAMASSICWNSAWGIMLTLLAPDILEAIMDGRQPAELGVHVLRFPVGWVKQRSLYFGF
jgi:hypothetical protein